MTDSQNWDVNAKLKQNLFDVLHILYMITIFFLLLQK